MGLDHLADDDVMIALLDDRGHAAFDRARRIDEDRRTGRALAVSLAAQLAVADVGRPEEREGETFCSLPSMLSANVFAVFTV